MNKTHKSSEKRPRANVLKINLVPNTYLIAYQASNERILTKAVQAYSQREAINTFVTIFPWNQIIAVTLLEGDF